MLSPVIWSKLLNFFFFFCIRVLGTSFCPCKIEMRLFEVAHMKGLMWTFCLLGGGKSFPLLFHIIYSSVLMLQRG